MIELRVDMTKKLSQAVKHAIKDLTPEERRPFRDNPAPASRRQPSLRIC